MGEHELREALRSRAQERIQAVWQAAEAAVTARRAEVGCQRQTLLVAMEQRLARTVAAERRSVLTATGLAIRQQRLAALAALAERLYALAGRRLHGLGDGEPRRLWGALAAELPSTDWQRVYVHPDDLEQARQIFVAAEVEGDAALAGGLVAETAGGRIVVDNSLAGRLERAWPGLLTPLLAAVYEEMDKDAAGPAPAG